MPPSHWLVTVRLRRRDLPRPECTRAAAAAAHCRTYSLSLTVFSSRFKLSGDADADRRRANPNWWAGSVEFVSCIAPIDTIVGMDSSIARISGAFQSLFWRAREEAGSTLCWIIFRASCPFVTNKSYRNPAIVFEWGCRNFIDPLGSAGKLPHKTKNSMFH